MLIVFGTNKNAVGYPYYDVVQGWYDPDSIRSNPEHVVRIDRSDILP